MRARLASVPLLLAVTTATGALAGSASAAVFQQRTAASATAGIAVAADGSTWVVEEFNNSVAHFAADGTFIARYAVGNDPQAIAAGPGGRIWVSVTGAKKLVWFDALSAAPAAHDVPVNISTCGPSTIVDGGNGKMYFSLPNTSSCVTGSHVGQVNADGTGAPTDLTHDVGTVYGLAAYAGKIYAASESNDSVYRLSPAGTIETSLAVPAGSSPEGIAIDGSGTMWVSAYGTGQVLRAPVTQTGGSLATVPLSGGTLTSPAGVTVSRSGNVYVAGSGSANLLKIAPSGQTTFYPMPDASSAPFGLAAADDGSLVVSNQNATTFYRFVNRAPVIGATTASPVPGVIAAVTGTVDPGGNDTTVSIDYGTTTNYGQSAAVGTVPTGVVPAAITGTIGGLAPTTTYHVRVVATNSEGTTLGPDATVTTLDNGIKAGPPAPPTLAKVALAKSSFKASGKKAGTTISLTVAGAAGSSGAVSAVLSLQAKGVKKRSHGATTCVAAPKKKAKGQKSCTRPVQKGTLTLGTLPVGTTTLPFTGAVGKKKLAPGKYVLVVSLGTSSQTISFTVKR